jgi:DNA mismatch repair protein MutS
VHLDAVEHEETIIFMHAVKDGPADRSYGLHVAALAGVPREVIRFANQRLTELENAPNHQANRQEPVQQYSLFNQPQVNPLQEQLDAIDPDDLTPKRALELIYQLKSNNNN